MDDGKPKFDIVHTRYSVNFNFLKQVFVFVRWITHGKPPFLFHVVFSSSKLMVPAWTSCDFLVAIVIYFISLEVNTTLSCFRKKDDGKHQSCKMSKLLQRSNLLNQILHRVICINFWHRELKTTIYCFRKKDDGKHQSRKM